MEKPRHASHRRRHTHITKPLMHLNRSGIGILAVAQVNASIEIRLNEAWINTALSPEL